MVAQTFMEGDAFPMRAANILSANPKDLPGLMLKKLGDTVAKDEPIARSKGIFGMMKTEVKSAADGVLESISDATGMVIIRGPQHPVAVQAYVSGEVIEVISGEGVVIENAKIGPHVSIGDNSNIYCAIISNSILQKNVKIKDSTFSNSMVGNFAELAGVSGSMSISDYSTITK